MSEKKKIVIGMSGGVDSSAAAYLLKKQGYEVIGVTMRNWMEEGCISSQAEEDAKAVADTLGIEHHVFDFRPQFQKHVVDYFISEYLKGRTPNPCNECNRYVKWEALLNKANELGAEYIATGHYARIDQLENGRYAIKNSVTATKDQTYALYNLTQEQLKHTMLPIGDYSKDEIRAMAKEAGLSVADKSDSQDICFIPDGDYAAFLEKHAKADIPKPGNFVDLNGNVLGQHKGITHYTIGQRKGLGIALGRPAFVCEINPQTNEVVLGENDDLFTDHLVCFKVNYMGLAPLETGESIRCMAKVRYAHKGTLCQVMRLDDDRLEVVFDEKVRAITPGQAVVFYQDEYVLGGGTII